MMMLKDSRQKRVREGRKKNKRTYFFCFFWHGHGLFSLRHAVSRGGVFGRFYSGIVE